MTDEQDQVGHIFAALRALVNRSFPVECSCGETFTTLDEFLERTRKPEREHGLFEPSEYDDPAIANLLRECPVCESTLMAVFSERRDMSDKGARARVLFEKLLQAIASGGLPATAARDEILKVIRGAESDLLRTNLAGKDTLLDELSLLTHPRD